MNTIANERTINKRAKDSLHYPPACSGGPAKDMTKSGTDRCSIWCASGRQEPCDPGEKEQHTVSNCPAF